MIYEFGPDGDVFKAIGGGQISSGWRNPVWVLIVLTDPLRVILKLTTWGRHLYAIGGQRAGGAADRRAGRPHQAAGLHRVRR